MTIGKNKLIISTMRDEGPYILEWIAYHRAIGFTDFLIYTNDCRDGTDLLLDRLDQNGVVTHVRNKVLKRGPHKSALKYAMDHPLYQNADWVYVCDADEFLNIQIGDNHVDDLINRFDGAEAIPLAWRLFSNNGHETLSPGPILQAYSDAEPQSHENDTVGRFVKSIFRPNKHITRLGLHAPVYDDDYEPKVKWGAVWLEKDSESNPRRPTQNFGYEVAQVNHYAVKSVDAYLIKRDRGRANHTNDTLGIGYWNRWCKGGEVDTSIQRNPQKVQAEYDQLIADPVVQYLHEGTKAFQEKRLQELLQDAEMIQLRADILGAEPAPAPQAEPAVAKLAEKPTPEASKIYNQATTELIIRNPARHQNRLKMLDMMPKNGRCAEIGVWNGGFSGAILEVTKPTELNLIDPWDLLSDQSTDEHTHKKHKEHDAMREMYDNVSNLYGHLPNVTIHKGFSAEVLSNFPDNYFDWVYIDGNHLYDFVYKDVQIAFQKVRTGGIIAGDDFFWKRNDRMHVKEAVLDAMRDHGMTNRPNRIGQQFMIEVPA